MIYVHVAKKIIQKKIQNTKEKNTFLIGHWIIISLDVIFFIFFLFLFLNLSRSSSTKQAVSFVSFYETHAYKYICIYKTWERPTDAVFVSRRMASDLAASKQRRRRRVAA